MKGSRIHSIVRELENENIDVIQWTENIPLLISRALSPAKISSVQIDENGERASVFLKPDQVSLAIGKGGLNIKLASRLIGMELDVFRDVEQDFIEEDVDLDEFSDEIDAWILSELHKIGLDTAKSVLALSKEELVRRTELEEETVEDVLEVLAKEFE
jgi:N utilization substance protein A